MHYVKRELPSVLRATISICKAPIITTKSYSYNSFQFHCTCLTMAKRDWSNAIIGVCWLFSCDTGWFTTSIPCLIITADSESSRNNGTRTDRPASFSCMNWEAWQADQRQVFITVLFTQQHLFLNMLNPAKWNVENRPYPIYL